MSDLSWLNPTPHAIAVYASRPLSPVATQHSLPSGRYPLLGPDFHRLDRTSLRLAHSFEHPVGTNEKLWRNRQTKRLGGLEVDDELHVRRLVDGQIGRLGTLQDSINVVGGVPMEIRLIGVIRHQTPGVSDHG